MARVRSGRAWWLGTARLPLGKSRLCSGFVDGSDARCCCSRAHTHAFGDPRARDGFGVRPVDCSPAISRGEGAQRRRQPKERRRRRHLIGRHLATARGAWHGTGRNPTITTPPGGIVRCARLQRARLHKITLTARLGMQFPSISPRRSGTYPAARAPSAWAGKLGRSGADQAIAAGAAGVHIFQTRAGAGFAARVAASGAFVARRFPSTKATPESRPADTAENAALAPWFPQGGARRSAEVTRGCGGRESLQHSLDATPCCTRRLPCWPEPMRETRQRPRREPLAARVWCVTA